MQKISPFLWFDDQVEEAVAFYTATFPDSEIIEIARYPEAGQEVHGKSAGAVMTISFKLAGQHFTALNGGPEFKFNEALSLMVVCETQAEVDGYWEKLSAGVTEPSEQCGWIRDKFGLFWQIVPAALPPMLSSPDRARAARVMAAMLRMKKLDLAQLQAAYNG